MLEAFSAQFDPRAQNLDSAKAPPTRSLRWAYAAPRRPALYVWTVRDFHWKSLGVLYATVPSQPTKGRLGVAPLIKDIEFGGLIADKAFDSNWIIQDMNERGAQIVISQHPRRIQPLNIDAEIYKWRHLIENFFGKEFKRIALRSDKTDASFDAMIQVCSAIINSR